MPVPYGLDALEQLSIENEQHQSRVLAIANGVADTIATTGTHATDLTGILVGMHGIGAPDTRTTEAQEVADEYGDLAERYRALAGQPVALLGTYTLTHVAVVKNPETPLLYRIDKSRSGLYMGAVLLNAHGRVWQDDLPALRPSEMQPDGPKGLFIPRGLFIVDSHRSPSQLAGRPSENREDDDLLIGEEAIREAIAQRPGGSLYDPQTEQGRLTKALKHLGLK